MKTVAAVCALATAAYAGTAAGLKWTDPPSWKNQGSRPMRAATYEVPLAPGDRDATECVVYFFGAGQGGGVAENIARWKSQFQQPGGKPADARVEKRPVHGLPVTTIDVSGDYEAGMASPNAGAPVKSGYRMLGAIIEGPGGNIFLKLSGPSHTITQSQAKFEALLNSFERQ